jgi:tetratricopeptide (TPR) repeat protein
MRLASASVMSNGVILIGVVAWMLLVAPAMAANQKDIKDCDQQNDPDRMVAGCTRLINAGDVTPQRRAEAYNNRGVAWVYKSTLDKGLGHEEAGRLLDRAIADYTEALRLNPGYDLSYWGRGHAWWSKGEFDRAISDLTEAIRLNPKRAEPYDNRGVAWRDKGDLNRAIADFTDAIRLNPKSASTFKHRGNAWTEKGDFERAIADYNESIRLDPEASAYTQRGEAWRSKGDLDRAIADHDRAIRIDPKSAIAHINRGDTLRYKGELSRALVDYDQALSIAQAWGESDYIPALTGRGLTYERMGDYARARIEFEKALASRNRLQSTGISKSSRDTAQARLAALASGAVQPVIPAAPSHAASPLSIPTPRATVPSTSASAGASKGRRVALVIANSNYRTVPVLPNPKHDAQAIAATLRALGFENVNVVEDATREALVDNES